MSRFTARLFGAAALLGAMAAATPASAQQVKRIVAFGDSYADDGNLFELLGIPQPPVYPTGRFSDSTNFIDTMALLLGVPVDNFAIGGAFTGNGNINGPGIPGFVTEYQSFLAGGGPAAFPRVTGTFGPDDLVVVSVGGNDARAYERSLGLAPTSDQIAGLIAGVPAQAAARVAETTIGLNALVNAGARNITFLVGDVGRLPEVRGLPVAAVGTAYANSYNSGLQTSLANIASKGVIVNYLDLSLIGNVVESNLSAFGLVSAGACPLACAANPDVARQYLFYVDQVHLTSAGFSIVGRYAVQQLEAPLTFAAHTDLGVSAASDFGQLMSGRLDLGGGDEHPLAFFVVATTSSHDSSESRTSLGYDYDNVGAAAGIEYDMGSALVGAAISYSRPDASYNSGTGRTRAQAYQIGAYAKFEAGGAFAEGYAGFGRLSYDMRRRAVIDDINAETDGTSLMAGGEVGYLASLGSANIGPVAGLQYARVKMDGYTESGDPVLTLNVEDRRASELLGFAGLEADFDTEAGGLALHPYLKLLAEKELDSSDSPIRYAGTASPIIVNTFNLEEGSDELYGRLEGGVSFDLGSALSLEVQASTTIEHPQYNEVSGFAGFKLKF